MKTIHWILTIIVLIMMLSSCEEKKDPPNASFVVSSETYLAGDGVIFTNTSTNASSYLWEFGDGTSSTQESPIHIYTESGTYTVTLTAINADGSDEATQSVTIKDPPSASFTHSSDNYEAGDTVMFINHSTKATSYEWDFGDGTTSTEESPIHVFYETGTYTVTLTATNDDGSDVASEDISIKEPTILQLITYVTIDNSDYYLPYCYVMLFESEEDWENAENMTLFGMSDGDGVLEFYHVKPITYYYYALYEETDGNWFGAGSISVDANETNTAYIPCFYFPDTKKSEIAYPIDEIKKLDIIK